MSTEQQQRDTQIANTIIQQLGGGMFVAFTGTQGRLYSIKNGLQIHLPPAEENTTVPLKQDIARIQVILTSMDDYIMRFFSSEPNEEMTDLKIVKEYNGVYCDQLRDLFTEETGWATGFGR